MIARHEDVERIDVELIQICLRLHDHDLSCRKTDRAEAKKKSHASTAGRMAPLERSPLFEGPRGAMKHD
jgi:hypothetical protein